MLPSHRYIIVSEIRPDLEAIIPTKELLPNLLSIPNAAERATAKPINPQPAPLPRANYPSLIYYTR